MITEPEIQDEPGDDWPGAASGDLLDGSGEPAATDSGTGTGAALRSRRPWWWAVGGMATASVVWAAVLHGTGGTDPDLHGYRVSSNPCYGATFGALRSALHTRGYTASDATVSRGPAVDTLSCTMTTTAPVGRGWVTDYTVDVNVHLHKRTDPRPEFENTAHVQGSWIPGGSQGSSVVLAVTGSEVTSQPDVHRLAGVGDEAYLLTPRASDRTLEVLHGGAVFSVQVSDYSRWEGPEGSSAAAGSPPDPPTLAALRPSMVLAMRRLMTSLSS